MIIQWIGNLKIKYGVGSLFFLSLLGVSVGMAVENKRLEKFDHLLKSSKPQGSEPYIESVAYRSLVDCRSGEHSVPRVDYKLIWFKDFLFLPVKKTLVVKELEIHDARVHGAPLSQELAEFLDSID